MVDINLLIVEDDEKQLLTYIDAIEEYNLTEGKNISYKIEKDPGQCLEHLKSSNFDAAIVDLKLEGDQGDLSSEASGNIILKEITQSHRFPIMVVTSTPLNIDPSIKESIFLQVHDKTIDNIELLKSIENIYMTGITKILGTTGDLEDLIQKIFWNHISDGFEYWIGKDARGALLRYSISHLSEYLDQSDSYLEPECFITPPIKKFISTGDIVEEGSNRYVVMNPACDLQLNDINGEFKRKSNIVTLVEIIEFSEETLKSEGYIEEKKSLNADKLKSFVSNNNGQFAFLPTYNDIEKGLIDFTKISTINIDDYEKYNRLATIAMPFLKDIQGRFSQYYGRQGQPDLEKDRIVDELSA